MSKVRVDEDICPLSEFRAEAGVVLMYVDEFGWIQERLKILVDVYRAEEQLTAGEGVSHDEAKAGVRKGIASRSSSFRGLSPTFALHCWS